MTSHEPQEYLEDILLSARLAIGYVANIAFADFESDVQKQDSVVRRLTIIGEAAGKLPGDIKRVWSVVQDDLPPLVAAIEAHLT